MARATAVYLRGSASEPFAFALGRYERQAQMCQNRHVYTSPDGERALWWADGGWYVGTPASIGKRSGFLCAKENTDVPEDVATPWQAAAAGNVWVNAAVVCVTEDDHEEACEKALADAAAGIELTGTTPTDANCFVLGVYIRQPRGLFNERCTYTRNVSPVGPLVVWFNTDVGSWYVGQPADVGSRRGVMMAQDSALAPESIKSGWLVAGSDGFQQAPDVRCTAATSTSIADAAMTAPSDDTQGSGRSGAPDVMKALTLAVVQHTMAHDGPAMAGRAATTGALQQAFAAFDLNRDGALSASELLQVLTRSTAYGDALSLDDASTLIQQFDRNGDGVLDFSEVRRRPSHAGVCVV